MVDINLTRVAEGIGDAVKLLQDENAALRKRVERLEDLLKPFAFIAQPKAEPLESLLIANTHCLAAKAAIEDKP